MIINHTQHTAKISSMWFFMTINIKANMKNCIYKISIIKIISILIFSLNTQNASAVSARDLTDNAANYISNNGSSFGLSRQQINDFVNISSSQFRNKYILSDNERLAIESILDISLDGRCIQQYLLT